MCYDDLFFSISITTKKSTSELFTINYKKMRALEHISIDSIRKCKHEKSTQTNYHYGLDL